LWVGVEEVEAMADDRVDAPADNMPRLLLRIPEAAVTLGISRSRCYELVGAGKLPHVRIGGSVRIPVDELKRWIAANTNTGS
jgi:excisionase family DNA binding protein